jgi:sugar transferase (PEP-CTERM system associated)
MRVRLLGQNLHLSFCALAAGETVLFFGLLIAAGFVRLGPDWTIIDRAQGPLWPRAIVFSLSLVASFLAFGLYSVRQRARSAGIAIRVVAAIVVGVLATSVVFYLIPDLWIGRGVLSLAALGAGVIVVTIRLVFYRFVDETQLKRRVIVYGAGRGASTIADLRRRSDQRGFLLLGFVPTTDVTTVVPAEKLIGANAGLLALCVQNDVDEIVVALDDRRGRFPIADLLECRLSGIDVTELPTFLERETGRVRIDVVNPSWLIFGEGFNRGSLRLFNSHALGLAASLAILVLTLPVIVLTMLAIKLEDGLKAPVFYGQERVGLGGRTFKLLKFRSMQVDAESDGAARWAERNDPRVTRVGAVIRKLRIDELPQIVNVLYGDMNFVGPRPERPQFVAALAAKIPYYMQRHCVKPGITGWAQVCYPYGSSERDAIEKLQYDLYYIKNNGLLFDLSILMQTVEVVFMGKGAR